MFRIAAATALLLAAPVLAGMPVSIAKRCPVGGERFTHIETMSYSTWGARPDAKPYGSWKFPLALPVCPGNGLVMFRDFSGPEVAQLKTIVVSTDYRGLAVETPYYRAAWLARVLDPSSLDADYLLLKASWESDDDLARKARYQRELVSRVGTWTAPNATLDAMIIRSRAANAMRELGDFTGAKAALAALPVAGLDVPIPAATGEKIPDRLGTRVDNYAAIEDAKQRRGLLSYITALQTVVDRRDASSEPLDMLPIRMAVEICQEDARKADPLCRSPEIAAGTARQAEAQRQK